MSKLGWMCWWVRGGKRQQKKRIAFNLSTQEAEAGTSLWVQGQSGLQNEFQDSQGYKKQPCLDTLPRPPKKGQVYFRAYINELNTQLVPFFKYPAYLEKKSKFFNLRFLFYNLFIRLYLCTFMWVYGYEFSVHKCQKKCFRSIEAWLRCQVCVLWKIIRSCWPLSHLFCTMFAFQNTNKEGTFMPCLFLHDLWKKPKPRTQNSNTWLGHLWPLWAPLS